MYKSTSKNLTVLYFLGAICVLFLSGHPLVTIPKNIWLLFWLIGVISTLCIIFIENQIQNKRITNALVILIAFLTLTFIYEDFHSVTAKFIMFVFFAALLCYAVQTDFVLISVALTNYYLILISLIFYILTYLLQFHIPHFTFANVNGVEYKSVFIFNWFSNHLQFRNTGFYWEPGLFSTHILLTSVLLSRYNLATLYTKFFCACALLSTFSVFGFALSFLIFDKNRKDTVILLFLLSIIMCVLTIFGGNFMLDYLYTLSNKFFMSSASVMDRLASIRITMELFYENPLGIGIGNFYDKIAASQSIFTSSVIGFLVAYPIIFTILLCLLFYEAFNNFDSAKIVLIIMLAGMKEPLLFCLLVIVLCMSLSQRKGAKFT